MKATELRVLRSTAGGADVTCLLATVGGKKAQQLRVKALAKSTVLGKLCEIEVRPGTPK